MRGLSNPRSVIFLALIAFLFPVVSDAATLRLSPASATSAVSSTVSVVIQVSSPDKAMNAASGILKFPADLLQVVSLSKTSSVISLWAQEPSFSNAAGTVDFQGIVLNPGFTGTNGTVLTITFKAKNVGAAPLTIDSGSVLANDGNGTEILTSAAGGTITVSSALPPASVPASTPVASTATALRLVITSTTHPDPEKSYRTPVVHLAWKNPTGTEAVRILYDKNPGTTPSVTYNPPIESKEIEPGNGIWYFHAQARSSDGWGPITHFKFKIDPNAPDEIASSVQPVPQAPVTRVATSTFVGSIVTWVHASQMLLLQTALAIMVLLSALVILSHYRVTRQTRGGRVRRVHDVMHEEFKDLKEALVDELAALDHVRSKRDLTAEEERILARFSKMLDKSERHLGNEIDGMSSRG